MRIWRQVNISKQRPMKILVCIKQIADTDAPPQYAAGASWLREDVATPYRMNRYDEYALEEALLLKDRLPGVEIHVLSVGPERVTQVIGKALSKGADDGVHIRCDKTPLSAFETATLIARYAAAQAFDLIFTGVMSEDAMQCQVGPMLAALLSLPCAVSIVAAAISEDNTRMLVESELEAGLKEQIMVPLPALVTVQTGGNRPRYASLSNILRAKGKTIRTLEATEMTTPESRELFLPLALPPPATKGIILTGSGEEQAERLLQILHERSLL